MALGAYFSANLNGALLWEAVEDYWPRRLLHIPTMTSYQRGENNTYNHCERPRYSILSYTWGRWEKRQSGRQGDEPGSESIPVKGVTWKIPIIKEEHFSVRMFQNVINEMGRLAGTDWAWVDVACIDQENVPVKMDEVGRQASIFKNAWKAFTWLSHTPEEALVNAIAVIERAGPLLLDIRYTPGPCDYSTTKSILHTVEDVKQVVEDILLDPWFSSLWTLQELFLRDDALILGQNGNIMAMKISMMEEEPYLLLSTLRYELQVVMDEMLPLQQTERLCPDDNMANIIQTLAKQLTSVIERRGFVSDGQFTADNPNVQYSAAKFRQTMRPEDRVYAICQIYNIRVGQTLRPHEPAPELDSLIEEFGLAINARSPILGQLFVHTTLPQTGRSWCITQESEVPYLDQTLQRDMQCTSTISKTVDDSIVATGPCCTFEEFQFAHLTMGTFSSFYINLDGHIRQLLDPNKRLLNPLSDVDSCEYYEALQKHYASDSVRILLLGHSEGVAGDNLGALKDKLTPRQYYGVLIQKCDPEPRFDGADVYQRLGTCHWTTLKGSFGQSASSVELLEGIIGESGSGVTDEGYYYKNILQDCQDFASEVEKLFTERISVTMI